MSRANLSAPDPDHRLCVAPMLEHTDRHARFFLRQISRRTLLYTEMITSGALLRGDAPRYLDFDPAEHPVALQVGGSDPGQMARCARLARDWGYDEININVGCPSERVRSGAFGACLMAEPQTVAACVAAMRVASTLPVTVKTRIGVDERDAYADLLEFAGTVSAAGCTTFIIHARKAWLKGLSPRENRSVPPLLYERVYRLKQDLPELEIVINGGVRTLAQAREHLGQVDGVMIGREAYHNPYLLAEADSRIFGEPGAPPSREEVLRRMLPYLRRQHGAGVPLQRITRHMLGLYHGQPGARRWRRTLGEQARGAGPALIEQAMAQVARPGADATACAAGG